MQQRKNGLPLWISCTLLYVMNTTNPTATRRDMIQVTYEISMSVEDLAYLYASDNEGTPTVRDLIRELQEIAKQELKRPMLHLQWNYTREDGTQIFSDSAPADRTSEIANADLIRSYIGF